MAETHFIEVVAGRGEPPSLELRPGVELAPLSVGTGGAWQISAAGVQFVHLYIYFDGQTLFLQSPEAADPPTMDGHPVPAAWTPVSTRCMIAFGAAQLVFRPAEDVHELEPEPEEADDPTIMAPVDPPPPPAPRREPVAARPVIPARPFKPGAFAAPVDESTRLQPLEDFLGGPPSGDATRVEPLMGDAPLPVANVRPAAGSPWNAPPPASGPMSRPPEPSVQVAPQMGPPAGPPSGLLNIAPPSLRKPDAPEPFGQKVSREWKATPTYRKALLFAMPFGLGLLFWLLFAGSPAAAPPPPKGVAGAPSASASASAGASASAVAQTPPVPPPPSSAAGTTPPVPEPQAGGGGRPLPPAATAAPAVDGGVGDRRERQAADFVATHNYDQAIRIYEQLATERPQNPAFHEAARILRDKLESGKP